MSTLPLRCFKYASEFQLRLQYERTARPGALAAGKDALRLQSRVQLLDNDHMGQYLIGKFPSITL